MANSIDHPPKIDNLLQLDPWLKPFEGEITRRYREFRNKLNFIDQQVLHFCSFQTHFPLFSAGVLMNLLKAIGIMAFMCNRAIQFAAWNGPRGLRQCHWSGILVRNCP
jgi:hypothetical protein